MAAAPDHPEQDAAAEEADAGKAKVTWAAKDTVPTVQYGSVQLFASVSRPAEIGQEEEQLAECAGIVEAALRTHRQTVIDGLNADPSQTVKP